MISEENAPPIGAPPTEVNGFEHATNITRVEDHPLKRCSKVDERIITEKDAQTKRCEGEYSPPVYECKDHGLETSISIASSKIRYYYVRLATLQRADRFRVVFDYKL